MEARAKQTLSAEQAELLRQIPSVDELLAQPRLAELASRVDRSVLVEVTRTVLAELRLRITDQAKTALLGEFAVMARDAGSLQERITALVERILGVLRWLRRWLKSFDEPRRNIRTWNTIWRRGRVGSGTCTRHPCWSG